MSFSETERPLKIPLSKTVPPWAPWRPQKLGTRFGHLYPLDQLDHESFWAIPPFIARVLYAIAFDSLVQCHGTISKRMLKTEILVLVLTLWNFLVLKMYCERRLWDFGRKVLMSAFHSCACCDFNIVKQTSYVSSSTQWKSYCRNTCLAFPKEQTSTILSFSETYDVWSIRKDLQPNTERTMKLI